MNTTIYNQTRWGRFLGNKQKYALFFMLLFGVGIFYVQVVSFVIRQNKQTFRQQQVIDKQQANNKQQKEVVQQKELEELTQLKKSTQHKTAVQANAKNISTSKSISTTQQFDATQKVDKNVGADTAKNISKAESINKAQNINKTDQLKAKNGSDIANDGAHIQKIKIKKIENFDSQLIAIKKLVINQRLKAGTIYLLDLGDYDFNEWVMKWQVKQVNTNNKFAFSSGHLAGADDLAGTDDLAGANDLAGIDHLASANHLASTDYLSGTNEHQYIQTLRPFHIYMLDTRVANVSDVKKLESSDTSNASNAISTSYASDSYNFNAKNSLKGLKEIFIEPDFINKNKSLRNSITTIGKDNLNSAKASVQYLENTVLGNNDEADEALVKQIYQEDMISQIVYVTGKTLVIKPVDDFDLNSLELWQVIPSSKGKQVISSARVNNVAQLTNYETTYNLDMSSGFKFSTLNIIPRVEWGANPSVWDPVHKSLGINDIRRLKYVADYDCRWLPEYYKPTRIVIHHTVTRNYPDDPLREIREIYVYHAYSRGWGDVGYNYLIDSSGRIFEGKIGGDGVKGYHAYEAANDMSIGIALIGNFTSYNPSIPQLVALKHLMAEKAAFYGFSLSYTDGTLGSWLNSNKTVFGHRHVWVWNWDSNSWYYKPTACPGEYFVSSGRLRDLVSSAQNYLQDNFGEIKNARTWAQNMLTNYSSAENIFAVVSFSNMDNSTREQLMKKIPAYSGLKNVYLGQDNKLHMTIGVIDNGYCGWVVPPKNWNGYDSCGSQGCMYFPTYKGPYDRAVILFMLFKLNPVFKDVQISNGNLGWVE